MKLKALALPVLALCTLSVASTAQTTFTTPADAPNI
jgi:hypothetical protein